MANIIKQTGFEGNTYGDIQILSKHKDDKFYVRVHIEDNKYKIASLNLDNILNNNIIKFQGKLIGNPYWHMDNNTTILFDINGKEIIIDTEDFEKIRNITWRAHICKDDRLWYAYGGKWIKEDKKWIQYSLHRYILDISDTNINIDHEDCDGLNNVKSNLRIATITENNRHRRQFKNTQSGFTGVRLNPTTNNWQARITVNKQQIYLGESPDIEEAKRLRIDAEKKYFGKFSTARS